MENAASLSLSLFYEAGWSEFGNAVKMTTKIVLTHEACQRVSQRPSLA